MEKILQVNSFKVPSKEMTLMHIFNKESYQVVLDRYEEVRRSRLECFISKTIKDKECSFMPMIRASSAHSSYSRVSANQVMIWKTSASNH